jgi:hypothetical protein
LHDPHLSPYFGVNALGEPTPRRSHATKGHTGATGFR